MIAVSTESPIVSVLMAAYNAERFICQAVATIQKQTLRNWELVICDDGSNDATRRICQSRASQDPRIRLVEHSSNRGMSAARNSALAASRGAYVTMMDADDECDPHRLEQQLEFAAHYPNDLTFSSAQYQGQVGSDQDDLLLPEDLINAAIWVTTPVFGPTLMTTRETLKNLGGYCESIRSDYEDIDLVIRAALRGARIRTVPFPLYRYRLHTASHSCRNRRAFFIRYDNFFDAAWSQHLHDSKRRKELAALALQGLRGKDWPVGPSRRLRRKAASIAMLLAVRFFGFGERALGKSLLNSALALCPWRPDLWCNYFLASTGVTIQLTSFRDRRRPWLLVRQHGRIAWLA